MVAFHIYASEAYEDFRRLLERVSRDQGTKIPSSAAAVEQNGTVVFIKAVRQMFESQPWIYQRMISELDRLVIQEADRECMT